MRQTPACKLIQSPSKWNTGPGANGHYYQRIDTHSGTPLTFDAAVTDAAALTYDTGSQILHGRLAVFDTNYDDAFAFVRDNVMQDAFAHSDQMYWVGASSPDGNASPNNWTWINSTPVSDTVASGWNIDHFEGNGAEGIGYYTSDGSQLYDYIKTASSNIAYGYVVEYVPEPTSLALLSLGGLAMLRRRRDDTSC